MLKCWDGKPEKRPSFTKLVEDLEHYVEEGDQNQYLDLHGQFQDEWNKVLPPPTPKSSLVDKLVKRTSSNFFKKVKSKVIEIVFYRRSPVNHRNVFFTGDLL